MAKSEVRSKRARKPRIVYGVAFESLADLAQLAREVGAPHAAIALGSLVALFKTQRQAGKLPTKQGYNKVGVVLRWKPLAVKNAKAETGEGGRRGK